MPVRLLLPLPPAVAVLATVAALAAGPIAEPVRAATPAPAERVEGSGAVVDAARDLPPFRALVLTAPFDVTLKHGGAERAVVHADDNVAPLIETRVEDGTLTIGVRAGASYRTRTRIRVGVDFRHLESVVVNGAGDVRIDRVSAPIFDATLRGSGDVTVGDLQADTVALSLTGRGDVRLAGRAGTLGASITGAGDIHADKLEAREVAIRIAGRGDARVNATASLKVHIAGAGDVRYRGSPVVSKTITGAGDVRPLR